MIRSMTGFGRGKAENENINVTVDMKSVNHRYLEMSVRLPREYTLEEEGVRKLIKENLKRGKVEIYVNIEVKECESDFVKINMPLANAYKNALSQLKKNLALQDEILLSDITKFPDIIVSGNPADDVMELNFKCILEAVKNAVNALVQMRTVEGERLAVDLRKRVETLKDKLDDVKIQSENLPKEYTEKLRLRLEEMLESASVPEERIAQEVAIFADKSNITEEIVRLESHIMQMAEMLSGKHDGIGKKSDFLVQEMNRETNTIASKANKLEITKISLDMKYEIEKIREQIQNLE